MEGIPIDRTIKLVDEEDISDERFAVMDHIGQNALNPRNGNPFKENYSNRGLGNYPRTNQYERDFND